MSIVSTFDKNPTITTFLNEFGFAYDVMPKRMPLKYIQQILNEVAEEVARHELGEPYSIDTITHLHDLMWWAYDNPKSAVKEARAWWRASEKVNNNDPELKAMDQEIARHRERFGY